MGTNAPDQMAEGVAAGNKVPGGHEEITAYVRQDIPAQLHRRRAASRRCEPLRDGRRDPWSRRTHGGDLRSWAAALSHLDSVGLTGLPPEDVRDALAERGWAV